MLGTSSLAHFKPDFRARCQRFSHLAGAINLSWPICCSEGTPARSARTQCSGVGNHARYLRVVAIGHQHSLSQFALGLWPLRRKDVPRLRLATLDLAGASLRKALGRALMCLQLRHLFLVLELIRATRQRSPCPSGAPNSISQAGFPAKPALTCYQPYSAGSSAVNAEQHGFSVAWKFIISIRIPSGSYMLNWYFPSLPIFGL